jgi:hypothetical protein
MADYMMGDVVSDDLWWFIGSYFVNKIFIERDYPLAISANKARHFAASVFEDAAKKRQRGLILDIPKGNKKHYRRRLYGSFDRDKSFLQVKKWHRKRWNLIEAKIQHEIMNMIEHLQKIGGNTLANYFLDVPPRAIEDAMWAIAKKLPGDNDSDDDNGEDIEFIINNDDDYIPVYDDDDF